MATYQYTPMPAVEGPQVMSIGDMINTARGAQAYQQAQQLNPLAVQQQQQLVAKGGIELSQQTQADRERRNLQEFFNNPDNFQTNGRIDIDKINKTVPTIAPFTGQDVISKYTTLGKAQTEAIGAKQNLTQDQRNLVASRFSVLGRLGIQDKNAYLNEMELLKKENPDNPDLNRLIDAYKTTWNEIPSGPDLPGKAIAGAQTLLTPTQQQTQLAPSMQVTADGRTILSTPSVGAKQPTAEIGVIGGMQPNAAGTKIAPGMSLPYPVRRSDQPYMREPTEEKDQTSGYEYRNNLVNGQMSLSQGRRNVDEVIQQANKINDALIIPNYLAKFGFEKGGAPEAAERAVRQFFGSEQYDLLAKDLAQMSITNSKAMGHVGGTVAGLDLSAVANGTIKVTPDVLIKIARRVQADQTNLDMQASGAQQFYQKFGDNNMKAYQQAWNANSKDTKIFEAMNVLEKENDPEKLKKEFEELFPSAKKRKTILKQYKNLKSLAATGVQAEPITPEDF